MALVAYGADDSDSSPEIPRDDTLPNAALGRSLVGYAKSDDEDEDAFKVFQDDPNATVTLHSPRGAAGRPASSLLVSPRLPPQPKFGDEDFGSAISMHLIPPPPEGQAPARIVQIVSAALSTTTTFNSTLMMMKEFHNPYILDQCAKYFGINQYGSNFPTSLYDPALVNGGDQWERLANEQKDWSERKAVERERQRLANPLTAKIEFGKGPTLPPQTAGESKAAAKAKERAQALSDKVSAKDDGAEKRARRRPGWDQPGRDTPPAAGAIDAAAVAAQSLAAARSAADTIAAAQAALQAQAVAIAGSAGMKRKETQDELEAKQREAALQSRKKHKPTA